MYSVTGRIHQIKQPRGSYLPIARFQVRTLEDAHTLAPKENLHPTVVGLAVDYLTRLQLGAAAEDVFQVALEGARRAEILGVPGAQAEANGYLARIQGLDGDSIKNTCKLVTFDVWKRSTFNAFSARPAEDTNPDTATLNNIRVMVNRGLHFWQEYGPVTHSGFDFRPFGYTRIVSSGDGDYLTEDTLWDFKVSAAAPKSRHTLQLLMYWVMGQHSGNPIFADIVRVGFFNPRLNTVYTYNMADLPPETLHTVEREVIGY